MATGSVRAGKAYILIEALDKTKAGIAAANHSISQLSKKFDETGGRIASQGMQIAASMAAVFTAPVYGLKQYAQFEKEMLTVQAKGHMTAEQYKEIESAVRHLGATTAWTTGMIAENARAMSSKGLNKDQILTALAPTLDFAMAVNVDDPQAATGVMLDTMKAYGDGFQEMQRYADAMTTAVNGSSLSLESLMYVLQGSAAQVSKAGFSIEDHLAMAMAMANAGVTGTNAATAIKNFVGRLAQRDSMFADAGVQIFDADGNYKDFKQIFVDVQAAIQKMNQKDAQNFIRKAFGAYGMAGIMNMLSAESGEMGKLLSVLQNCEGEAAKTAAHMQSGIWGTIKRIESAAYDMMLSIGEAFAPLISGLETVTVGAMNWINSTVKGTSTWVRTLLAAAGVLIGVGVILAAVGLAIKLIGLFIGLASTAMLVLRGAVAGLYMITVGLPALFLKLWAVILALGSPVGLLAAAFMTVGVAAGNAGNIIETSFAGAVKAISNGDLSTAWELIVLGMKAVWLDFCGVFIDAWAEVIKKVMGAWVKIENIWHKITGNDEKILANDQWLEEWKKTYDEVMEANRKANADRIAELTKKSMEAQKKDGVFTPDDVAALNDSTVTMPAAELVEKVKDAFTGGAGAAAVVASAQMKGTQGFEQAFRENLANAKGENTDEKTLEAIGQLTDVVTGIAEGLEDEGFAVGL